MFVRYTLRLHIHFHEEEGLHIHFHEEEGGRIEN